MAVDAWTRDSACSSASCDSPAAGGGGAAQFGVCSFRDFAKDTVDRSIFCFGTSCCWAKMPCWRDLEFPEVLFQRRIHEGISTKVNKKWLQFQSWFAPAQKGFQRFHSAPSALGLEFMQSIARMRCRPGAFVMLQGRFMCLVSEAMAPALPWNTGTRIAIRTRLKRAVTKPVSRVVVVGPVVSRTQPQKHAEHADGALAGAERALTPKPRRRWKIRSRWNNSLKLYSRASGVEIGAKDEILSTLDKNAQLGGDAVHARLFGVLVGKQFRVYSGHIRPVTRFIPSAGAGC